MSFHINFFASFLPIAFYANDALLPPLGRRRRRCREVRVRRRRRGQFGLGMNGGNSRTINDNYSALAAIRNT